MNQDDVIRRLATVSDEDAARIVSEEARAQLAKQIMAATPKAAPARRRRALIFGAPLAAAAVAVAVSTGVPGLSHGHRADVRLAALSFSTEGKYLVVKVKDPYADPKRYAQEFAAHGMKIRLWMAPVSPSLVGTVVFMDGGEGIETITENGRCWTGGGGYACPVGVRIPIGYHKSAGIMFGRTARPGEPYTSTASGFAVGEELHCIDIRGRTVAEALAMLKRHKISVAFYNYESGNTKDQGKIPGTWYVSGADPYAPGQVQLAVQRYKPGPAEDDAYYHQLLKGCH